MHAELRDALRSAIAVRFLCTGNVVRSAFAELYARHLGCPLPVDSAATVFQNERLFPETRAALLERGVDPALCDAFRPRHLDQLDPGTLPRRLVVGMGDEHLTAYRARFPHEPCLLVSQLCGGRRERLPDPVLEGASFSATFDTLAELTESLVDALLSDGGL